MEVPPLELPTFLDFPKGLSDLSRCVWPNNTVSTVFILGNEIVVIDHLHYIFEALRELEDSLQERLPDQSRKRQDIHITQTIQCGGCRAYQAG